MRAMGARISGDRAARVAASPNFDGKVFVNRTPASVLPPGSGPKIFREMFFGKERRKPSGAVPIVRPSSTDWELTPGGLSVIWLGHATSLVEIEGHRVLLDPVWSLRCSPTSFAGPKRLHPMPLALAQLPALDAIVISHDHYDHLDMATVRELTLTQMAPFLVPLGVGAHLERWKVPADRIIELDWNEEITIGGLQFVATEARHFSGRSLRRNDTLWGSWVIAGKQRRVFYTGDTGYFPGFAEIGSQHGPFDLTLIQIGAYSPYWPDIHMTPEEAVATHLDVRGGLLLPVHWATFNLALHSWGEPVDRIWRETKQHDVTLTVPKPGERVKVDDPSEVDGWWQALA
ncbi:Zn-dependent hydrolase [Rhizocola hellebori]|uniref:Zn-dependent hydrolase n=1 Tax=Rhizocola hellebori TaxID=1392758 RepID=A0A8J3VI31_9ACTN|nr:Zn-dependent hydrolase [Rhizocola hellebori]